MQSLDLKKDYLPNITLYESLAQSFEKEKSAYSESFIRELKGVKILLGIDTSNFDQQKTMRWDLLVVSVLAIFILLFYLQKRKSRKNDQNFLLSNLESLTIREREILILITKGYQNKEIANELNLGLSTVKTHVSNCYQKLNVSTRKKAINLYGILLGGY